MSLVRTSTQWIHLFTVVAYITGLALGKSVIQWTYRLFPLPSLLDWLYARSAVVRRLFSYRLRGACMCLCLMWFCCIREASCERSLSGISGPRA